MRLSIVVPAHNEEKRIGPMLDAYLPFFSSRYGDEVEFIVVVNGSTDHTEDVARGYAVRFPGMKICVEPRPVGKGGAVVQGFKEARGEWVGFVDADGSTPPEAFQDLVDRIDGDPAIIASRWCRGARVDPPQPLFRRIASRLFNLTTRLLFGLRLTDTQCGAKLFRRDALQAVLPHLGITKWAFDVDLLFQFRRLGYALREVPTVWQDVEGSKIAAVVRTSIEMFVALVRLRLVYSPCSWIVRLYDRTFGLFIRPGDDRQDYLLRHSVVLLTGSQVSNVLNLLFQLVMVRILTGEDHRQYGIMAAMMGLFFMASTPLSALGRMVSHYVAAFLRQGQRDRALGLVRTVMGDCLWVAVPLLAVGLFLAPRIAPAFQLASTAPVVATFLALFVMFPKAVTDGALNGAQAFFWSTAVSIVWSVGRLVFAVALVLAGLGATGAIWGNTAATICSLVASLAGLALVLGSRWIRCPRERGVYGYFAVYMVALMGYGVLANADTVLVKLYFSENLTGQFAAAILAARVVYFLPLPIAAAMFPKIVSGGVPTRSSFRILAKSLLFVALLELATVGFVTVFPLVTLRVLTGQASPDLVPLTRGLAWALSPLPLVFVLMNFELAQRRYAVTLPLIVSAGVYGLGVARWHGSLAQVTGVIGASALLALVGCAVLLPWREQVNDEAQGERSPA